MFTRLGLINKEETVTINEICQILVLGALNDTKPIRKPGGDIFAKSGPEKAKKKLEKLRYSPDYSNFSVDLA